MRTRSSAGKSKKRHGTLGCLDAVSARSRVRNEEGSVLSLNNLVHARTELSDRSCQSTGRQPCYLRCKFCFEVPYSPRDGLIVVFWSYDFNRSAGLVGMRAFA